MQALHLQNNNFDIKRENRGINKMKRDIFLSRPTWIDKKYEKGLEIFIQFLYAHNLNPRTIGTTDFPNQSPLDEVIKLMQNCVGAIILGYPQIIIKKGEIKNQSISNTISLGTEWNHIEAALAYSLHVPILVIHDNTVTRGIFDRGTLNAFIYSLELSDATWASNPTIIGALTSWIERLTNEPFKNIEQFHPERPTLKWGCYKFEGIKGLYCPVCYEEKGLKIATSRINGGIYKCPKCNAKLS